MSEADSENSNEGVAASPVNCDGLSETALYEVGCEIGQLIDLLDIMIAHLDEDWVDPAANARRVANLGRIARSHAGRTLATVLAAEG